MIQEQTPAEVKAQTLDQEIIVQDPATGEKQTWTLADLLEYVNADRSGEWTDYDITDDWKHVWNEWVDPECWVLYQG